MIGERIKLENGGTRVVFNPEIQHINLEGKSENFKERYEKYLNKRAKFVFKNFYKNIIKREISDNENFALCYIELDKYSKDEILKMADFAEDLGYKVTLTDCDDWRQITIEYYNDGGEEIAGRTEYVNVPRIIFDWSDNPQIKLNYIKEQTEEYLKSIENVKVS